MLVRFLKTGRIKETKAGGLFIHLKLAEEVTGADTGAESSAVSDKKTEPPKVEVKAPVKEVKKTAVKKPKRGRPKVKK